MTTPSLTPPAPTTSVTPSPTGVPIFNVTLGNFEFISVQGTGEIFTYDIGRGSQVQVGAPYATPCSYPSGMVIASIGGNNVMAVACYDTGSLLTLSVHTDGSLGPLGSVSGLPSPYPGIALDGTNVLVPLFGVPLRSNGAVAKISIASPALPVITAVTSLLSPFPGGTANPGKLTVANGYIFIAGGSESSPLDISSTVQVMDEATMALVGHPLVVAHSPQQIAVSNGVAYVSFYDAMHVQSIDISDPGHLKSLQVLSLAASPGCEALPIVVRGTSAYVGCNSQGVIKRIDISDPSNMHLSAFAMTADHPQHSVIAGRYLLVSSSVNGGSVSQIDIGPAN